MNSQDLRNLQEAYLTVAENVSTGAGKRASRGGIAQRPSAREIEELKAAAKRKPEPIPEEKPRQKRKGVRLLPSGGAGAMDKVLRGGYARTPKGIASRRATELDKMSRRLDIPMSDTLSAIRRRDKIRAALKKSKKWGTPEAAAEEVILGYLIDEGIADCLGSAEIILENMSDEWFEDILNEAEKLAPYEKMIEKSNKLASGASKSGHRRSAKIHRTLQDLSNRYASSGDREKQKIAARIYTKLM